MVWWAYFETRWKSGKRKLFWAKSIKNIGQSDRNRKKEVFFFSVAVTLGGNIFAEKEAFLLRCPCFSDVMVRFYLVRSFFRILLGIISNAENIGLVTYLCLFSHNVPQCWAVLPIASVLSWNKAESMQNFVVTFPFPALPVPWGRKSFCIQNYGYPFPILHRVGLILGKYPSYRNVLRFNPLVTSTRKTHCKYLNIA